MRNLKIGPAHLTGAWRFWNHIQSLSITQIVEEAERPVTLALVGTSDQANLLAARLALETPTPRDLGPDGPANVWPFLQVYAEAQDVPKGSLILDADLLTADEGHLAETLAKIVLQNPYLRLSLARHLPAFRPAVVAQMINESAWHNAKIALVSALPGVVPFGDVLMPATALGDMLLLTKNQGLLLLKIAAAYGKGIDLRERSKELLPVVGSAFGWRALARELIGLVPGGIGLAVKGAVAYAGTYAVGKAASIYYSTGQTLSGPRMKQLYHDAFTEAKSRVRRLRSGRKAPKDAAAVPSVQPVP